MALAAPRGISNTAFWLRRSLCRRHVGPLPKQRAADARALDTSFSSFLRSNRGADWSVGSIYEELAGRKIEMDSDRHRRADAHNVGVREHLLLLRHVLCGPGQLEE